MSIFKKNRIFICCIISLLTTSFVSCRHASQIDFLRGDLAKVFAIAQKTHKKVFILITDSTCSNCNNFLNFLNKQTKTVAILSADYVCYKADIGNAAERKMAEIVKCPAYPFPYFFDEKGNLLAFGFPNSKNYDISNLKNINVDKFRFTELFKLPVSIEDYKKLISWNVQATLMMQYNAKLKAYDIFKNSLDISFYPYNVRNVQLLSKQLGINNGWLFKKPLMSQPSESDIFLYGNTKTYMLLGDDYGHNQSLDTDADYSLDHKVKELGEIKKGHQIEFSFNVKNQSAKPLVIYKVSHPCGCIRLTWPTTPVAPNVSVVIKGIFNPYTAGQFNKEIFVHTNSLKMPMGIFTIKGTVLN